MRTKHRTAVGWLVLTLIVTGCTTATPYQPYRAETAGGVHGGYSDQQVAPDRYIVARSAVIKRQAHHDPQAIIGKRHDGGHALLLWRHRVMHAQ